MHSLCADAAATASPAGGDEDPVLAKTNVMSFRRYGTQGRINKMVLHAADHAFCKAFLIKHFPRSERVRQHMTEALQVAGCVEGGVLAMAAATVQNNVAQRDNPVQQAANLGGTGLSLDEANAPPVVHGPIDNSTALTSPLIATNFTLALIDRMPNGSEKTAFIMREFEANRKHIEAEYKANEERRMVVHNKEIEKIHASMQQEKKESEARMTRLNNEIKDKEIASLTAKRDACTDPADRAVIESKLQFWDAMPTTQTYTVNQRTAQAPAPLAQAVIATNNGSISDVRLPPNVAVIHIDTQRYLTLAEFMPLWWREDPLDAAQLVELGREVAKAHDQLVANGRAVRNTALTRGVAHAPRAYSLFELTQPPLHGVIEKYVLALRNGGATRGRKRKAAAADAAGTRSMREFVALGTRVA